MFNVLWQTLLLVRSAVSAERFVWMSVLRLCSTVPVGDVGSLAIDPSLLMVLITKFFSRVKLVRPTLSELSITNMISRAPQRFSQSETTDAMGSVCLKRLGKGIYMWWTMIFAHHSNHTSPSCKSWHHSPAVPGMQVLFNATKEI